MSQIQQFYAGRTIFITGATGFLGKSLTEKLLRSCPEIGTIYLLIREKKGKSVQERIDALLLDPVFEVLRRDAPNFSKNIVGVNGDVAEKRLGLSAIDYSRIVDEVSVIFHVAATVRFNEKLDRAVVVNVDSVKSIIDIAKACKILKAGVHVSTAYSHCVRKSIKEELYPPPLSYEGITELVETMGKKTWSQDEYKNFEESVIGGWPNTYSFTKAVAEGVVAEFAKDLPFAVFRPSIVMNAYNEPLSGWFNGPMGLPGLLCGVGIGILRVFYTDQDVIADVVPVDYVTNALISCAWNTAIVEKQQHEDIPIYNYVSCNDNPTTVRQMFNRFRIFGRAFPMNSSIYYPSDLSTKSLGIFNFLEFFLQLIPAFIVDSIGKLFGKQLGMYKLTSKIGEGMRALGYFTTREWEFDNQRVKNLWNKIGLQDRQIFPFNIRVVDWDEHTLKVMKGFRKYITDESDDTLEQARRRHFYLHIIHTIVRLVFTLFLLWIIWKLFCGRGFATDFQTS